MNKKIYLFTLLLSVIFFDGCDDVYDHVAAPPQAYEQEAEQSIDGFTIGLGTPLTSPIILLEETLADETTYDAVRATATPELAEGASVTFKLEASASDEFVTSVELPSTSINNTATITAVDLDEAVKSLYGKAPNAREIYIRATYYIVDGTTSSQMPTPVVLGPVTVTPVSPVIETEYYLIGNATGWNIEDLEAYKFSHSGNDVYEDPIFSILVNNLQGYFKIVPKSSKEAASWDGLLGNTEDGNTALEGELVMDGNAMRVEEPGWVKVTLNMMEGTYTIDIIGEMNLTLYVPGGHQGWNPETAPMLYSQNFDFTYDGYVYFDGEHEFKFTSSPSWNPPDYGDGGEEGVLAEGGGNLKVTEEGHYRINVDLSGSPYTYSVVKTEWGLIGDATPGGWDSSTSMAYDVETGLWTVTATLEAKDFKFRANDGWDINVGGDLNNLTYGGDNITVSEAGTYLITLDLSDPTAYKATMVKQ